MARKVVDEKSPADPEPVRENVQVRKANSPGDQYIIYPWIIMVLTIWQNLDIPKLRLVEAVERRSIFQGSILEPEILLVPV